MKRELIPYYISRAAISILIGLLMASSNGLWSGVLFGIFVFVVFVWYAHSGRYLIDTANPLNPLKRDTRGKEIRNRALVIAVAVGGLVYGVSAFLKQILSLPYNMDTWALIAGAAIYFTVSNWHYIRDKK